MSRPLRLRSAPQLLRLATTLRAVQCIVRAPLPAMLSCRLLRSVGPRPPQTPPQHRRCGLSPARFARSAAFVMQGPTPALPAFTLFRSRFTVSPGCALASTWAHGYPAPCTRYPVPAEALGLGYVPHSRAALCSAPHTHAARRTRVLVLALTSHPARGQFWHALHCRAGSHLLLCAMGLACCSMLEELRTHSSFDSDGRQLQIWTRMPVTPFCAYPQDLFVPRPW
ncbi:hypothetical protein B0H14DRAFT_3711201 [Mycena olivaceomarginata]|nr:hypothetical protein B0H14DRAFT_3711201 [Mycena olivaceomarginata]